VAATSHSQNYWPDSKCAKAFWHQHQLPSYKELLDHTVAWLEPHVGEHWLDLGCGCGQLSQALWQSSHGQVAQVIGLDCAAANAAAYEKLRGKLSPPPTEAQFRFAVADLSNGLTSWPKGGFDGVVSGLAIQYAESFSAESGCWTTAAYDRVLSDVFALLRPGGRFVFSVNVPEPSWGWVAWKSLGSFFRARRFFKFLKHTWRMYSYGGWLKREARRGRFHYLPIAVILDKLARAGFVRLEHRLSYAKQAYVIRAWKPETAIQAA
jgi:SAM-dependent methyltransferase